MARIYKESRYVLQLLIGKSYVAQYDDVKISFYTKNPSNQVMVDNGITIKRNIAEVMVESTLFDNLEEGLISYIVYGTKDGIPFIEERQSNYFLKIPLDFKPTTCILEDKSVTPSMGERNNDGYIVVEEGEGYDGLSRVVIDPQTLYNEGIEAGYGQGKTDGINEQKSKLETISITENGTYAKEDGYNHIEVNVIPKINVKDTGLNFAYSTFKEVPEWADFNGITDMENMFNTCRNLESIEWFNTELVANAKNMFSFSPRLKTLPNNFNFGNCINMECLFLNTDSITDYSFLETWVINPNANMGRMISNTNTTYVPAIPCVGDTNYYQSAIFWASGNFSKLTYFGGWIGRKYNVNKDYILNKMPNLTYESCISILNNLYDFTGNGETPDSNQGQLKVHQNFLDTVGEEISIGTNKGWQITV